MNIIKLIKTNIYVQIAIILIISYFIYKQYKIEEGFYGLDLLDSADFRECCQKWGCGSWACQQLLLYKKPLLNYIGTIYSTAMPPTNYLLYKKWNDSTASYDYLYKDRNDKFVFIDFNKNELKNGDEILIENFSYKVNLIPQHQDISSRYSKSGGVRRLIKGDFKNNIKPYSLFNGHNVGHKIDYDHYYPPLYDIYKRPVHYSTEGDFMVTTGQYGILAPLDKSDKNLILYEREIRPNLNEYQYFVKYNNNIIELSKRHKISDGDIIKIPGETVLYKFEKN